jgi:uncharacterized membrane protein
MRTAHRVVFSQGGDAMLRLHKLWEDLKESLWLRPALWTFGLGGLAVIITSLDRNYFRLDAATLPWFLISQAEGARTMLGSISAAMLTVTTLVFSITMVAVVHTANAYSPRVLREYLSDTANHHVLGILIGTFLYSLIALRGVEVGGDGLQPFVPIYAANGALLLSLLSILAFIYFLDHVAHSIKVNHIIRLIMEDSLGLARSPFPTGAGEPWPDAIPPPLPDAQQGIRVVSPASGYLQMVDTDALLAVAQTADLVVRLDRGVGEYLLEDAPVITVWGAGAAPSTEILAQIQAGLHIGSEQTLVQDLLFGLRQLSDIALRALSPAVNDPSTTSNCIDALATVAAAMLAVEPASPYRCDAQGRLRLIAPSVTFDQVFDHAFSQIRRYGAGDVSIVLHLLAICRELGSRTADRQAQETLGHFVQALADAAAHQVKGADDRQRINAGLHAVAYTLPGAMRPGLLDG